MVLGMAPMYGPKNGMTLVTPTITLMSATYGMRSIRQHTKQIAPIMSESMILPLIKPPNILSLSFKMLESTCIWRSGRNALTSLFSLAFEGILAKQDIDGNDECNKTVYRCAKDSHNTVYHKGNLSEHIVPYPFSKIAYAVIV